MKQTRDDKLKNNAGCLGHLLQLLGIDLPLSKNRQALKNREEILPYRKRKYLLTKAEKAFWLVLRDVCPD